jgi:uncharacterized protein (TIGR02145 family)
LLVFNYFFCIFATANKVMPITNMKKIVILILFFSIGSILFAQVRQPVLIQDTTVKFHNVSTCDSLFYPGWGESLGVVSFVSDREWRIEGNGIVQIWSDAVQATGCDKEHIGGSARNRATRQHFILTDCRSNPDHPGDFFSWCAVARFADTLCPAPWRVPTAKDFCGLDKILFNRNKCNTHIVTPEKMIETYINLWGGAFGGGAGGRGILFSNVKAYYWSSTIFEEAYAYHLNYDVHGNIQSQCVMNTKGMGFSLRCIRDE